MVLVLVLLVVLLGMQLPLLTLKVQEFLLHNTTHLLVLQPSSLRVEVVVEVLSVLVPQHQYLLVLVTYGTVQIMEELSSIMMRVLLDMVLMHSG